jgi:16S rRNA (guanine(527)-N(7))-methyltransferase RsmG
MNMPDARECAPDIQLWQRFTDDESLTYEQVAQFRLYYALLTEWNNRINLTAITALPDVIDYHFRDSLAIGHVVDLSTVRMVADVGTGAGFPGIALKIKYPYLHVILIEVVQKKIKFLHTVIQELGLTNIEVVSCDWLTFLHTTNYPIELFCARASLAPDLLVTMFAPWCAYKKAELVYWAASSWSAPASLVRFLQKEVSYTVGQKQRKLVFLKSQRRTGQGCNVTSNMSKHKGPA